MRACLREVAALSEGERQAMCALLDRHFWGVDPQGFAADLADKTHVLQLLDENGALCGFTTFALMPSPLAPATAGEWLLFSGDTIVDEGHRNSAVLAAGWIDAVEQLRAQRPIQRLLWLLICSSVRTYRFLPLFFREFFPHPDRVTPPAVSRELEALATWRYGHRFDPRRGLVILERPQPLRVSDAAGARAETELARFFATVNPGHREGDELVCHCVIAADNLTPAGKRMVALGRRQRVADTLENGAPAPGAPTPGEATPGAAAE